VTVIYALFLLNITYFDTIGTEIGQFEQAGFIIDGKSLRAGRTFFAVPGGPVRFPE
jgi:xanthine/uracil/vitamin C permease (AzgA family)